MWITALYINPWKYILRNNKHYPNRELQIAQYFMPFPGLSVRILNAQWSGKYTYSTDMCCAGDWYASYKKGRLNGYQIIHIHRKEPRKDFKQTVSKTKVSLFWWWHMIGLIIMTPQLPRMLQGPNYVSKSIIESLDLVRNSVLLAQGLYEWSNFVEIVARHSGK